ncbi:MAG: enoyl-CoA hydratase [Burkholderiales bacterium]|nr:enoyl-CoA hydratase [Burkholderiales bacterium]
MNTAHDAMPPSVLREDKDGIATLTLNRPAQFNAINSAVLSGMQEALGAIAGDASVRVVVVAGAGRVFCPGHDLKEMLAHSNEAFVGDLFRRCCDVMLTLRRIPQPVIARVHGIATAAGCQIVAASDLAVAEDGARFATSGINFGLFCATPGVPVSRNIAPKRAFEMLLTGDFIDAATALDWGLVNRVVPVAQLDAEVLALAGRMMDKPRAVIAAGKKFFYDQLEQRIEDAYAAASVEITRCMMAAEAQEGVRAFVEKRKPRW